MVGAHIIQEIREFDSIRKNKTEFDSLVQESILFKSYPDRKHKQRGECERDGDLTFLQYGKECWDRIEGR